MKIFKATLMASLLAAVVTLSSCGGESGGAAASDVKVPAEMTAFMGMLNGSSEAVSAALKAHGVEGLATADIEMYGLKDPKVVAADKDCYTMEVASGVTTRTIVLCWEGGKIKSVEDKGIK